MKTVFSCAECGYWYSKAWYEPSWLARQQYEPQHPVVHKEWAYAMANPASNPIALSWVNGERQRIIAILEAKCDVKNDKDCDIDGCFEHQLISLIEELTK